MCLVNLQLAHVAGTRYALKRLVGLTNLPVDMLPANRARYRLRHGSAVLLAHAVQRASRRRCECREHYTEGFEHPANLVVQAGTHTDQLTTGAEKQSDFVARDTLDRDRSIPATARQLSNTVRVVRVGFVQLRCKRCMHMARVNAINRYTSLS